MPRTVRAETGNVRKRPIRETQQAQYRHETALNGLEVTMRHALQMEILAAVECGQFMNEDGMLLLEES